MASENRDIVLIAPNVSEQMGGEAMKALQIFRELKKIAPKTLQVTHERNRAELSERLKLDSVLYVEDTPYSVFLWRSIVFRGLLQSWFGKKAVRLAESYLDSIDADPLTAVIHQTEPNSPVYPRTASAKYINVLGPINGNIYYPKIFRNHESFSARIRRLFHFPSQFLNKLFVRPYSHIDKVLYAGGERTEVSLLAAGCSPSILAETVDCGIQDSFLDRARIEHRGPNLRFVHFGRLVFHKCTFLIIESLAKTKLPVTLDVVGTGPELERCKKLVQELGLETRVRFLGWYTSHSDLLDSLKDYRGMVFPSIEDANGIVVQEAMALGLPSVCLDWGGPQLLIDSGTSGFLVEPRDQGFITDTIAAHLDTLSQDAALAEAFSLAGRQKASTWRWSEVAEQWLAAYPVRSAEIRGRRR